jgi:putative DNA methylase
MATVKAPKKLIEVALPLDAINVAAAREKSIRLGHPSTLHLWWARRPLAAARAVLFAQMVNDPGYQQGGGFRYGVNREKAALERERLFKIIEDLVLWENSNQAEVLEKAKAEILRSWRETCELNKNHPMAADLFNPDEPPACHDPFAGGGTIPLEAQRLGLKSYASDLNPVAVTINKAMIEVPPRFAGRTPIGPMRASEKQTKLHEDWRGARGLAEDVRRYGAWIRLEAGKRLGDLFPQILITEAMAADRPDLKPMVGQTLTVIAWLWARTVRSPNPAFSHAYVPLASTFMLANKEGKKSYVEPLVEGDSYRFVVKAGDPPEQASDGTKISRGAFRCIFSNAAISYEYIDEEANAGRTDMRLMAIVAEGVRARVYLSPTLEHEAVARSAKPEWKPEAPARGTFGSNAQGRAYGFKVFGDYFTPRQLVSLSTFADLAQEAVAKCKDDAIAAGMADDGQSLDAGGRGATAYAQAVGLYLALVASRQANYMATLCVWSSHPKDELAKQVFLRQGLPMTWDFAETNPLSGSGGNLDMNVKYVASAIEQFPDSVLAGTVQQLDARTAPLRDRIVSTDPPYFDNVGYADLSDFFYVWLRRSLRPIYPNLYATVAVPKAEELIAAPHRQGGKAAAEAFFLSGMRDAIRNLAEQSHPAFPVTIYYAFKQSETKVEGDTSSTGWETFLQAVIEAGFSITGTWPMRTELIGNLKKVINALASSIILVCRLRPLGAPTVSRREFIRELNASLPQALDEMTRGGVNSPVAPVDLSQAIIGPGMAIFSQYAAVLEADGTLMSVRTALQLINRFLAEDDFDHDTQFCLHWFEQQGWAIGKFGEADVLARAKGTSVAGLQATGVVESGKGELRLLRWAELPGHWSPETDTRLPVWEALHYLIRALNQDGESAAGALLARMPARAESIRALAYRLYTLCERKGWAEDARSYNELVTAWSAIEQAAGEAGVIGAQRTLDI